MELVLKETEREGVTKKPFLYHEDIIDIAIQCIKNKTYVGN